MTCHECERRRRYYAADPEQYRDEDWRCDAHRDPGTDEATEHYIIFDGFRMGHDD